MILIFNIWGIRFEGFIIFDVIGNYVGFGVKIRDWGLCGYIEKMNNNLYIFLFVNKLIILNKMYEFVLKMFYMGGCRL